MIRTIIGILIFAFCSPAIAEEKWISVRLERTPIVDRMGSVVERPVYYSKKKSRVTTGGEWIVPKELKGKAVERYQRGGELLMLVDVPVDAVLPGTPKTQDEAKQIKTDLFKVQAQKPESGVTKEGQGPKGTEGT